MTKDPQDLKAQEGEKDKQILKLQEFKNYVHKRLDLAGIPIDPESPHKEHGCRIGGRLDIALSAHETAAYPMSSTEEVSKAWEEYSLKMIRESEVNMFASDEDMLIQQHTALDVLGFFQQTLKSAIEGRKKELLIAIAHKTQYSAKEAAIEECDKFLELLSSVKPKEDRIEKKG